MKQCLTTLIFFLLVNISYTQSDFTSWSGDFAGSNGSVCSTVGQVFYTTKSGPGGFVTEGVQQPFEIRILTGIEEELERDIKMSVFPNPTANSIIVSIEDWSIEKMNYQLFDIQGRLLLSDNIQDRQSTIEMTGLIPSTYILRIKDEHQLVKTFQIIKN